jgi:hypothetical protein
MPEQTDSQPFGEWCVVELLGHRRLAGYVQEVQLAGTGFLRLDIPPARQAVHRRRAVAGDSAHDQRGAAGSARAEAVAGSDLRGMG